MSEPWVDEDFGTENDSGGGSLESDLEDEEDPLEAVELDDLDDEDLSDDDSGDAA